MDYLAQLNAIADLSMENMTPNDFAVYMRMLFLNNTLHWKEWFSVTYERLERMTGISSKHTIATAINRLEQNGYIQIERLGNRRGNRYKIVPLYGANFAPKAEQKGNNNGTKAEQKGNNSGTKPAPLVRVDESKREESSTTATDLLTNSPSEEWGGLTPAEEKVKSAFEGTFHPLTKLEDLDALRAYTGDYGAIAVTDAIAKADKSVKDQGRRLRLSPRYLLTILQDKGSGKVAVLPGAGHVSKPDNSWIPKYTTPEEDKALAVEIEAWRQSTGFYDYRKRKAGAQ